MNDLKELAEMVLAWWEEHQYDTASNGDDERNIYDETPDFVIAARCALNELNEMKI